MKLLYVGSLGGHAGKNLLCLGLGRRMLADGVRLAFMKPYGAQPLRVEEHYTDAQGWMINQELGLGESPEQVCPVVRTQDLAALALRHQAGDLMSAVKNAVAGLAAGHDLLLLAGGTTLAAGASCGLGGHGLVRELDARVLLVDRFHNELFLDNLLAARDQLGTRLLGVVINAVDPEMNDALEERVAPFLAEEGVPVLGWLPKDELLEAVEVGALTEMLGAKVLSGSKFADRLVMRFFIGAMQVGHAHRFFSGVRDFGCIVGGDRPDLQLAAIEGGAACLILTGNLYPSEIILSRAEEHEVPVLVARDDTYAVAQHLERIVPSVPLKHPRKIARGVEMVEKGVDFAALYAGLGLKPS
jgi:BioD-like phosphotransacetylase family protein